MNRIELYNISFPVPTLDTPDRSTENVSSIMKEHGAYLEQQTNGKIHGRFRRICGVTVSQSKGFVHPFSSSETAGQIQQKAKEQIGEMLSGPKLRDANSLYETGTEFFCFQIYNSSYQFNMLKMELTAVYPVNLWPDSGVLDEETRLKLRPNIVRNNDEENIIRIESDQDLISSLAVLFSSRKVQYILSRLLKMESEAAEEQNAETASVRTG